MQMDTVEARRANMYAFYAAETGLDRTIVELRSGREPAVINVQENWFVDEAVHWQQAGVDQEIVGFYSVDIIDDGTMYQSWPTVWVRVTGEDPDRTVTRCIISRVAVEDPTRFFTFTLGGLSAISGASIQGDLFGKEVKFLALPGLSTFIDGNVYYTKSGRYY